MIAKLPDDVARIVRAQQYINKRYIVIKELVENALDAGATQIKVQIGDGITVDDNGSGIEDLEVVAQNGYTSKENNALHVLGMVSGKTNFQHGFRGQALAAIRELSDLEISTRRISGSNSDVGYGYVKNYTTGILRKWGREPGTTVRVSNLFKTCPVRRQQDVRESKKTLLQLVRLFESFCYVYNLNISLFSYGKLIFNSQGCSNIKEYAISKYGNVFLEISDLLFDFLLFPLSHSQKQLIFHEKRVVASSKLSSLISSIFKAHFTHPPTFVLSLYSEADVNVSVDKTEVYLKDFSKIENRIKEGMDEYFSKQIFICGDENTKDKQEDTSENANENIASEKKSVEFRQQFNKVSQEITNTGTVLDPLDPQYASSVGHSSATFETNLANSSAISVDRHILKPFPKLAENSNIPDVLLNKEEFARMKIVGQFNRGFILCVLERNQGVHPERETAQYLAVVDQHAADEIYNFETLRKRFVLKKQKLLLPVALDVSPAQELLIETHAGVFERNGFLVEQNQLLTVPVYKNHFFTVEDFYQLLENVESEIYESDKFRNIMASKACRSSIMIGEALTEKEMRRILDNLSVIDLPWKCPHGRPTVQVISKIELRKNAE